jgi:predicted RNA-binding Zn-ribbon protein involved in translation (DUF1610 family)
MTDPAGFWTHWPHELTLALSLALLAIATLLALVYWVGRRNRSVNDDPALWNGRDYPCPECGAPMQQGWVLLGKGAIWSERAAGRPGAFSHIGQALPNTISMRLKPAANMAWRCDACRILTVDYDKLVCS